METQKDGWTIFGIAVIGFSVALWSVYSQVKLATLAGVPGELSWILPISTDIAVGVATRVYLDEGYGTKVKRYAGFIALLAAGVSVVLASVQHVIPVKNLDGSAFVVPEPLKLAIGGFPSLCLALIVHLAAMLPKGRKKDEVQTAVTVAVSSPPATVTVPTSNEAPEPVPATEETIPAPEPKEKEQRPRKTVAPSVGASLHLVPSDRPEWLTEGMTAKEALLAFFDNNPKATGADADRFGAQHLNTKPSLGRKVRNEWLARDQRAASGE